MKLTIDTDDCNTSVLSLKEVVERLEGCGALKLDDGERVSEYRLEFGCDLEIDIDRVIDDDVRCSGYSLRTETFSLGDINTEFDSADYCAWGKDDNGDDVLACFGV